MEDVQAIREKAVVRFLVLFALHIPLVASVAWAVDVPALMPTVATAAMVLALAGMWWRDPAGPATRYAFAVGAAFMPAMLVYLMRGHPWQIDVHMYFFALLAMVTAFCDWRAIAVGAATIALHHLTLNFIMPAAVFPDGASLWRVVLHAVVVVVETGALIWLAQRLVRAMVASREAVAEAQAAQAKAEAAMAEQKRSEAEAAEAKTAAMRDLADDFESHVSDIVRTVTSQVDQLDEAADRMRQTSTDTNAEAKGMVSAISEANEHVQEMSANTEQVRSSIKTISVESSESTEIVRSAVESAKQVDGDVQSLESVVNNIGEVVGLIQDIAERTNLLALNATIEASRAGEAGKGFAVVADEVKNLANQTQRATEDISSRIRDVQSRTGTAAEAINTVTTRVTDIETRITNMSSAIQQQESATAQIVERIDRARKKVQGVTDGMDRVGEFSQSAESAAERLGQGVAALRDQSSQLDAKVRRFLDELRDTG